MKKLLCCLLFSCSSYAAQIQVHDFCGEAQPSRLIIHNQSGRDINLRLALMVPADISVKGWQDKLRNKCCVFLDAHADQALCQDGNLAIFKAVAPEIPYEREENFRSFYMMTNEIICAQNIMTNYKMLPQHAFGFITGLAHIVKAKAASEPVDRNYGWTSDVIDGVVQLTLVSDKSQTQAIPSAPYVVQRNIVDAYHLYKQYYMPDRLSANLFDFIDDWTSQGKGVTDVKRFEEIAVTLTTYPARIETTWLAIESLLRQTEKPDHIVLNLFEGEFPGRVLPYSIREQMDRGLEINWCSKNLKVFLKVIPAIQKYQHTALVVVDDDIVYPINRFSDLMSGYRKNPDSIILAGGIGIPDKERMIWQNCHFDINVNSLVPLEFERFLFLVEGCAGILLPRGLNCPQLLNVDLALSDFSTVDDVWISGSLMSSQLNFLRISNSTIPQFIEVASSNATALHVGNFRHEGLPMTMYIRKMFEFFKLYEKFHIKRSMLSSLHISELLKHFDNLGGEEIELSISCNLKIGLNRENGVSVYKLKYLTLLDEDVEIVSDMCTFNLLNKPTQTGKRVLLTSHEPSPYSPNIDSMVSKHHLYDAILYNERGKCDEKKYFHHLGGFIFNNYFGSFSALYLQKDFSVSHLCSFSTGSASYNPHGVNTSLQLNYLMRKELIDRRNQIMSHDLLLKFYVSNRPNVPHEYDALKIPSDMGKAEALFQSQFTIAIENCCEYDYFSEKIIEPILNKVVPIYVGCPNISDYFDIRGILKVNDTSEIITQINELTRGTYQEMLPYIEDNYQRALLLREKNQLTKKIKSLYSSSDTSLHSLNLVTKHFSHLKMLLSVLECDSQNAVDFIDDLNAILTLHKLL